MGHLPNLKVLDLCDTEYNEILACKWAEAIKAGMISKLEFLDLTELEPDMTVRSVRALSQAFQSGNAPELRGLRLGHQFDARNGWPHHFASMT